MRKINVIVTSVLIAMMIVSCKGEKAPAIILSGGVEASFTQAELESMEMVESKYINKDNEATTFEGTIIEEILVNGGVKNFNSLKIIASDGYSVEVSADELKDCSGCILSYSEENGWSAVMPGFSGKLQVKDVFELSAE